MPAKRTTTGPGLRLDLASVEIGQQRGYLTRSRWVDGGGEEHTKSFQRKPDAQVYVNGLTADVQRGEYVDPRRSAETSACAAKHQKP